VSDVDLVPLLREAAVEGRDAGGRLHGHMLHRVGLEEGGDLLVPHLSLGHDASIRAQNGRISIPLMHI